MQLWFRMPEYSAYFQRCVERDPQLSVNLGFATMLEFSLQRRQLLGFSHENIGLPVVMPGLTPGTHNPPYPADKNNFPRASGSLTA